MDATKNTEISQERKRGQHLQSEERGKIEALREEGHSIRQIAASVHISVGTVWNELRRGKVIRPDSEGIVSKSYKAKVGQAVYEANRKNCRKKEKVLSCRPFVSWVIKKVKEDGWSFDSCVGYAKEKKSFKNSEMLCTKSLYNALRGKRLPSLTFFDVPEVLCRRKKKAIDRTNKRVQGRSIEERPEIGTEFGHWEIDTVIGRKKREECILTIIEKQTRYYMAIRINGKTSSAVTEAMSRLHDKYKERFSLLFKSITADNGTEFTNLSKIEEWGTKVYFAHPYSSWERPQNERHNRLLRRFIPKGESITKFSDEEVALYGEKINELPRHILRYRSPKEMFEEQLKELNKF